MQSPFSEGGDGKSRVILGVNQDGGALEIKGNREKRHFYVGVNQIGLGGLIEVGGTDAGPRVVIGVDNNSIGFVEGRDNNNATRRSLR